MTAREKDNTNNAVCIAMIDDIEKIFGFKATERTLIYITKRFQNFGYNDRLETVIQQIATKKRLKTFINIFRKIMVRNAFLDETRRNIDIFNAINFMLFEETQGVRVALEGLKSVFKHRKECSG